MFVQITFFPLTYEHSQILRICSELNKHTRVCMDKDHQVYTVATAEVVCTSPKVNIEFSLAGMIFLDREIMLSLTSFFNFLTFQRDWKTTLLYSYLMIIKENINISIVLSLTQLNQQSFKRDVNFIGILKFILEMNMNLKLALLF